MLKCVFRSALFGIFGFGLLIQSSWAGGLWLYESGAPDLGTAAAGRAALAADASTAGTNPAGMTRLERSQMLAAFQGSMSTPSSTPRYPVSAAVTAATPAGSCRPAVCTMCSASPTISD